MGGCIGQDYQGIVKPCQTLPNLPPQSVILSKAVEDLAEKGQLGATAGFPGARVMPGFPAGLD